MTLGEKIQMLRVDAGLSQEALAERLGVSRQAISKWELDKTVPEVKYISEMSSLLFGCSGRTNGATLLRPLWKSSNPSGISGPTETRLLIEGESGKESMTCWVITFSPAQTIILISAAFAR